MEIEHLVLPMAGLGKRLRPLTLRRPKALVPVAGHPLLWHVLEEAHGTAIRKVTFVISPQHRFHFERYLKRARREFPQFHFEIVMQHEPLGNGHAVLAAAAVVGNKPFAVRFPDDLLIHQPSALSSLIKLYSEVGAPMILLERVPKAHVSSYGVVAPRKPHKKLGGTLYEITGIVEKPAVADAPSNLTVVGGYVLNAAVLNTLAKIFKALPHTHDDVLALVAAFDELIGSGKKIYGWEFPGTRLDCGTLPGLKKAEEFLKKSGD